jgi:aminobenzoyl-glutamate utilization protein B
LTASASAGSKALSWIERHSAALIELSDRIWEYAEVGLQEIESAAAQEEFLRAQGFDIKSGVAGMPSAFVASWGSGKPVIGFLGEYDALPGISQKAVPVKDPVQAGKPGHGCGHNLLGVAGLAGACALKAELEASGLPGTIRYHGSPAEETLVGKVFMAKDGIFDDIDVCLDWHPGAVNAVRNGSSTAMNSVKFTFHGRTAHAAGDPHHGRSALDAVELMNIGANYLREHIIEKARIHYVITDGGGEPNVVPAHAQVWYYVRAPERAQVEEIYAWLIDIARGAALMTQTTFEYRFLAGCYNYLPNQSLNRLIHRTMERVGPNKWTEEELEFARKLNESFPAGQKAASLKASKAPPEAFTQLINDTIFPYQADETPGGGSTDVGDVSWITPTGRFAAATGVLGQPGHSWQFAACSGMSIGHKGMLMASKILALAGLELATNPEEVAKARAEWAERTKDRPYTSPIPAGILPPLDQLPKH